MTQLLLFSPGVAAPLGSMVRVCWPDMRVGEALGYVTDYRDGRDRVAVRLADGSEWAFLPHELFPAPGGAA